MMRMPALLLVKLAQSRIARIFNAAPSLMQFVNPAEILHAGSPAPVSCEKMQTITESTAPVIWIGGGEPLDHPGIAHFIRAIAQSGHFVFLEASGALLRCRIHEFQPVPQLFLTVRLDTLHALESGLAVEGLRAARLSGFFTAIHSELQENAALAELKFLRACVTENDIDGWLITAGSAGSILARRAAEARNLIPSVFWRRFSLLVERGLLLQAKAGDPQGALPAAKPPTETCEERERVA
jgi:hypothetical protein